MAEHFSKGTDLILLEVGRCLNQWTAVEIAISDLYSVTHKQGIQDWNSALRRSFEAVVSLEARLSMVGASIDASHDLAVWYQPHYKSLRERVLKLYKKRHEVAHFGLVEHKGECVIQPFFTYYDFSNEAGSRLDYAQLQERRSNFRRLSLRVKQHTQHVGVALGLSLERLVQEGEADLTSVGLADPIPPEL